MPAETQDGGGNSNVHGFLLQMRGNNSRHQDTALKSGGGKQRQRQMALHEVVPAGCSPGEVICVDMREGAGCPAGDLTTKQRSRSRPASGVRKVAKDILQEEEHETEAQLAKSSISETHETAEIVSPEAPEVEGRGNVEVGASLTESLNQEALIASGGAEMEQARRSPSMASRPSRSSRSSCSSRTSVHVQVPDGVKPGEKFFEVVDEVWAPEGSSPGEMVAMDVYKNPVESQKALTASRESGKSRRKGTHTSEPESVATDGSLVYVQIPDGSGPGETFSTDVNGFEYEILVPSEVPAKRTMGKFVVPENSPAALPYDAPSIFTALSDPFSDTSRPSRSDHLADIRVPTGVHAGQTFVVIIDGVELEVPVPEGYGAGDLMSLRLPLKGISPDPVTATEQEVEEVEEVEGGRGVGDRGGFTPAFPELQEANGSSSSVEEDCDLEDCIQVLNSWTQ